jgi:hypothetical protein
LAKAGASSFEACPSRQAAGHFEAVTNCDFRRPPAAPVSLFYLSNLRQIRGIYNAASSFIEGNCGSPYHGCVFLNSARQMAPTKNLSRG